MTSRFWRGPLEFGVTFTLTLAALALVAEGWRALAAIIAAGMVIECIWTVRRKLKDEPIRAAAIRALKVKTHE